MAGWALDPAAFREEVHFGDRLVTCRIDRPRSLTAMLRAAAARNPNGEALVCEAFRVCWRELEDLVERCARGLSARGIGAGDRAILFLDNRAEFVILLYALSRLGAIAVPVGVREQAPGLADVAERSGAKAIFYEITLADRIPSLPLAIPVGDGDPATFVADLASSSHGLRNDEPDEDMAALILYTSGTTGRPKGVIVTHLALVHVALAYARNMALGPDDRSACVVPLSHITGITAMMAAIAAAGGTLLVVPRFDARDFAALVAAERVTHCVLVPAMYNLLLARVDLAALDLSSWRIGGFGGAPMPVPTIERMHEAVPTLRLMNCYGATETCGGIVMMPPEALLGHAVAAGLPTAETRLLVMDDRHCQVAPGEAGELWIGGPATTPGYWNDPEATAANIVGGYWRSGDIASIDAEGYVTILDRLKDMINRGGYKIYGAEVESVLLSHPAVAEAAVVARPCPVLGERVHAVISLAPGTTTTAEALKAHCATRLTDYKQPESYRFFDGPLPRNLNGKVMKATLREDAA